MARTPKSPPKASASGTAKPARTKKAAQTKAAPAKSVRTPATQRKKPVPKTTQAEEVQSRLAEMRPFPKVEPEELPDIAEEERVTPVEKVSTPAPVSQSEPAAPAPPVAAETTSKSGAATSAPVETQKGTKAEPPKSKKAKSPKPKAAVASAPASPPQPPNPPGGGSSGSGGGAKNPNPPNGPKNPARPPIRQGVPNMPNLIFIDALEAQESAETHLNNTLSELKKRKKKSSLTTGEKQQLASLELILKTHLPGYAPEDLYITLRQELKGFAPNPGVPDLNQGEFGQAQNIRQVSAAEMMTAMVWGTLHRDGIGAPRLLDQMSYIRNDVNDPNSGGEFKVSPPSRRFNDALTSAVGVFNAHRGLFREVLQVMAFEDDVNGTGKLKAADWVSVTEIIIKKGLTPDSPGLATQIRAAINDRLAPTQDKVTATQEIILPNLEAETAQEVQRVNLEAAQAIYFAAMMDEARLFDSVDKLAELFQIGALPLERGEAGEYLYRYIRQTPDRISPFERRNTYARVFGAATGDPNGVGGTIFRNFDELWMRFVSSVSDWFRKNQVENLFSTAGNFVPSQEQVRKTGLDLAANLSLYCYGGTWFVASELQKNIADYINLLSSPEIKHLYGARDMWQVIDQISVLEFGQPVNTIRARTKANAGAAIIGWLEKHASALSEPGTLLIDPTDISNPRQSSTHNAINNPTDYDLVTACEQWLAIEGVGSDIVEVNASASPSAITSTAPVRVPPAAQDILGAFGFEHQGTGHDQSNRRSNGDARMVN